MRLTACELRFAQVARKSDYYGESLVGQLTSYNLRVTIYELQLTSKSTSYNLRVTLNMEGNFDLRLMTCDLRLIL